MILEALAIYGGLSLVDDLTPKKETVYLKENWIDKAGIKWKPEELAKMNKESREYLYGYDPLK